MKTMTQRLSFKATKQEYDVMNQIANRAVAMANDLGIEYDKTTALMDINATHSNGNPLRLDALLKADDGNFGHDVFGIRRHINRDTGKLEGFFVPRFSMPA